MYRSDKRNFSILDPKLGLLNKFPLNKIYDFWKYLSSCLQKRKIQTFEIICFPVDLYLYALRKNMDWKVFFKTIWCLVEYLDLRRLRWQETWKKTLHYEEYRYLGKYGWSKARSLGYCITSNWILPQTSHFIGVISISILTACVYQSLPVGTLPWNFLIKIL